MEQDRPYVPVSKKLKTENEDGIEGWDISFDTPLNVSMDDMHGNFDDHSLLLLAAYFLNFPSAFNFKAACTVIDYSKLFGHLEILQR